VGTVKVTSFRKYIISGYVDTSHGRVKTEVVNFVDFSSVEKFDITSSKYVQDINQDTTVSSTSGITDRGKVAYISQNFTYPLNLDISVAYNSDGSGVQTTTVDQQYNTVNSIGSQRGSQEGTVGNEMTAGDMLDFNNLGQITGNMGQQSSQHYTSNSAGPEGDRCYDRMIRAANGVLTGVQSGCGAK
jgi:hypothetical protein